MVAPVVQVRHLGTPFLSMLLGGDAAVRRGQGSGEAAMMRRCGGGVQLVRCGEVAAAVRRGGGGGRVLTGWRTVCAHSMQSDPAGATTEGGSVPRAAFVDAGGCGGCRALRLRACFCPASVPRGCSNPSLSACGALWTGLSASWRLLDAGLSAARLLEPRASVLVAPYGQASVPRASNPEPQCLWSPMDRPQCLVP